MSKLERVLEPDSQELPDCHCGAEMHLARSELAPASVGAETRVYECTNCGRELRLVVWVDAASSKPPAAAPME